MDEDTRNQILLSQSLINNALNNNITCKTFLSDYMDKKPEEIEKTFSFWDFAFKNINNWPEVEKKIKEIKPVENTSLTYAKETKTTAEDKPKKDQDVVEKQILENAELIIDFLTQVSYGKQILAKFLIRLVIIT